MFKFPLLLLLGAFFTFHSSIAQYTVPDLNYRLVAFRNAQRKFYNLGTMLVIKYKSGGVSKRVRGAFLGGLNRSIAIGGKCNTQDLKNIAIEDILMIRKVAPKKRLVFGIIGTVLLGGGVALLERRENTPGNAIRGALVIPVIGVGSYFLLGVPATLIMEKVNERKREGGWKFELSR